MSVRTTADENIDRAKTSTQDAIEALGQVLIDEYRPEYVEKLEKAFSLLRKAKGELR